MKCELVLTFGGCLGLNFFYFDKQILTEP